MLFNVGVTGKVSIIGKDRHMDKTMWLWPAKDMDFWKIKNDEYKVTIQWSRNYFEDYKRLSYLFYECGYRTFAEVVESGHDNIKSDMWFLPGIFLLRQSMELGLKALVCRSHAKNNDIQNIFIECAHDLSSLLINYLKPTCETYLTIDEVQWLVHYLDSLEMVDEKSDMFRFPFEDKFLNQFRDKFLNIVDVANNMIQAFALIKKCLEEGNLEQAFIFRSSFVPEFFVFANHGIGNCYLWQGINDDGFHVKVKGYIAIIDYIFQCDEINKSDKLYPLMFMFRNTIELCLKRLLYIGVNNGISEHTFLSKRKSHYIKKDLWKNVKPVILSYINEHDPAIDFVEQQLYLIDSLDKKGDNFRYPTSYSLEYRIDNMTLDLQNVYEVLRSVINFLDGCFYMFDSIADNEDWIIDEIN